MVLDRLCLALYMHQDLQQHSSKAKRQNGNAVSTSTISCALTGKGGLQPYQGCSRVNPAQQHAT